MRRSISSASTTVCRLGSLDSSVLRSGGGGCSGGALQKGSRAAAAVWSTAASIEARLPAQLTRHKAHAARILVVLGVEQALRLGHRRVLADHLRAGGGGGGVVQAAAAGSGGGSRLPGAAAPDRLHAWRSAAPWAPKPQRERHVAQKRAAPFARAIAKGGLPRRPAARPPTCSLLPRPARSGPQRRVAPVLPPCASGSRRRPL